MSLIGPKHEGKPAMEYVLSLYMAANPDPDRMCYSHFTVATGAFLKTGIFIALNCALGYKYKTSQLVFE